jgi:hypothetical protein
MNAKMDLPVGCENTCISDSISVSVMLSRGNPHTPGVRLADSFISVRCPSNLSFTQITLKTLEVT